MMRDADRIATMARLRAAIDHDPLKAHRSLGNLLLMYGTVAFVTGVLVGWLVAR